MQIAASYLMKALKYISMLLMMFCWCSGTLVASHIRGGEITISRVAGNPLAITCTLTVYTDSLSSVQDPRNEVFFGDGTSQTVGRSSVVPLLGKKTFVNIYYYSHIYSAFAAYKVYHYREYRNTTVINIGPNPDQVNFYVESRVLLTPGGDSFGPNRSPKLLNPAVDLGAFRQKFVHNPAAYDEDGDSLSFEIAQSRTFVTGPGATDIANYQFPDLFAGGRDSAGTAVAALTVNPLTGLLTWDVPNRVGEFNVAIRILEWRNGFQIGYVMRDMQILIRDLQNRRPILQIPADTCIVAGTSIEKIIRARDPDVGDQVQFSAFGSAFNVASPGERATFRDTAFGPQPGRAKFRWAPNCATVADQPYNVTFKVEDSKSQNFRLVDIRTWRIKVIGPAPIIRFATASNRSIRLDIVPYSCGNAARIEVWRKVDSSGFKGDFCYTGPPPGFELIDQIAPSASSYTDSNKTIGLKRGVTYCYRLVAIFPQIKGGESRPSNEVCAQLAIDIPFMVKVSVAKTDSLTGVMEVAWSKPAKIDSAKYPPPYTVTLKRRTLASNALSILKATNDIEDTTFTDSNLDTKGKLYSYYIVFRFGSGNQTNGRDSSTEAQNVKLVALPSTRSITLNWEAMVPWENRGRQHKVFKLQAGTFVEIGQAEGAATTTFVDDGSVVPFQSAKENLSYRYYVETQGTYPLGLYKEPIFNKSFEIDAKLEDTTKPCPPVEITFNDSLPNCERCQEYGADGSQIANSFRWSLKVAPECKSTIAYYKVYYKQHFEDVQYRVIAQTTDTFYVHKNGGSLAGCYKVSSVATDGKESVFADSICNDNCENLSFPNIITANGDLQNDAFRPICGPKYLFRSGELDIYNRWGKKIFAGKVEDGFPEWNGTNITTEVQSPLNIGTYYYYLKVKYKRLYRKDEPKVLRGWIEVSR